MFFTAQLHIAHVYCMYNLHRLICCRVPPLVPQLYLVRLYRVRNLFTYLLFNLNVPLLWVTVMRNIAVRSGARWGREPGCQEEYNLCKPVAATGARTQLKVRHEHGTPRTYVHRLFL